MQCKTTKTFTVFNEHLEKKRDGRQSTLRKPSYFCLKVFRSYAQRCNIQWPKIFNHFSLRTANENEQKPKTQIKKAFGCVCVCARDRDHEIWQIEIEKDVIVFKTFPSAHEVETMKIFLKFIFTPPLNVSLTCVYTKWFIQLYNSVLYFYEWQLTEKYLRSNKTCILFLAPFEIHSFENMKRNIQKKNVDAVATITTAAILATSLREFTR